MVTQIIPRRDGDLETRPDRHLTRYQNYSHTWCPSLSANRYIYATRTPQTFQFFFMDTFAYCKGERGSVVSSSMNVVVGLSRNYRDDGKGDGNGY